MLAERHQVLRIVTALEQQLKGGNLSVRNRQKLQQQITSMRQQYSTYFLLE
ncbi:hypothetical protein IQ266_05250 [filamentous cyanobacterium LEGE 11480]|uniref:Uncharacterized protein n=1 Tax=Romeriopsis navalis LEGE 11480 TaxID=2777977 RepID=A0A928VK14_9CYAN|nr:hypothetical protein [Romeriopsis navalis]MBE9029168.1 hypothetical protein [Romeriopsis navalis LEGE 11480]